MNLLFVWGVVADYPFLISNTSFKWDEVDSTYYWPWGWFLAEIGVSLHSIYQALGIFRGVECYLGVWRGEKVLFISSIFSWRTALSLWVCSFLTLFWSNISVNDWKEILMILTSIAYHLLKVGWFCYASGISIVAPGSFIHVLMDCKLVLPPLPLCFSLKNFNDLHFLLNQGDFALLVNSFSSWGAGLLSIWVKQSSYWPTYFSILSHGLLYSA